MPLTYNLDVEEKQVTIEEQPQEERLSIKKEKNKRKNEQTKRQLKQELKSIINRIVQTPPTKKPRHNEENESSDSVEEVVGENRYYRQAQLTRMIGRKTNPISIESTILEDRVYYISNTRGSTVSFTTELPTNLSQHPRNYPPKRPLCGVPNCSRPSKYTDAKTKIPLCSLDCYKKINS